MTIGVDIVVRGSHSDGAVALIAHGKQTHIPAGKVHNILVPSEHFDGFLDLQIKGNHGGHGHPREFGEVFILSNKEATMIRELRDREKS